MRGMVVVEGANPELHQRHYEGCMLFLTKETRALLLPGLGQRTVEANLERRCTALASGILLRNASLLLISGKWTRLRTAFVTG